MMIIKSKNIDKLSNKKQIKKQKIWETLRKNIFESTHTKYADTITIKRNNEVKNLMYLHPYLCSKRTKNSLE